MVYFRLMRIFVTMRSKLKIPKIDYSKIADYYDKVRAPVADICISKIIEYGKIDESSTVLDVGCGTGRVSEAVSTSKNARICSIDTSVEMLKKGAVKDKDRRILWMLADAHRLPFTENCFNCVYMTLVLHHLDDRVLALREIRRILKKDGNCVIMTISHSRLKRHVISNFPGVTAIDRGRFPSIPSIKSLMVKVGLRNVHSHLVKHDLGSLPVAQLLNRVRDKYISTLTLLSEEQFQKGFKIFQERVKNKYGDQIKWISEFSFVVGQK